VLKLLATLARYEVAYGAYGGVSDSLRYHHEGAAIAQSLRAGHLGVDLGGPVVGSNFLSLVTGIVYVITGRSIVAGFLVFSWLGFWGLFFCYRAFELTFPTSVTARRRYAALVFLLPSLLFWPSSIGKEAWMLLALGLSAYGAAALFKQHSRGVPVLIAGLVAAAVLRPHIAVAVLLALIAAIVLGRRRRGARIFTPITVIGMVVILAISGTLLGRVQNYFDKKTGGGSITTALDYTAESTTEGGSSFQPVPARSPVTLPFAVFSVIFRPLPFETGNLFSFLTSIEGTVLLFLILRWRRELWRSLRKLRDERYLAFAAAYSIVFCVAFSGIGNFGILARERAQLVPFLLVLVAIPREDDVQESLAADDALPFAVRA
jgi:hypothetical protein